MALFEEFSAWETVHFNFNIYCRILTVCRLNNLRLDLDILNLFTHKLLVWDEGLKFHLI